MNDLCAMKSTVEQLLDQALHALQHSGLIPHDVVIEINVERTKDISHGDYATNMALVLAKPCGQTPRKLAELIVQAFIVPPIIERVEIAVPGFINFFMRSRDPARIISVVLTEGEQFGRKAAFGAELVNVLTAAKFDVDLDLAKTDSSDSSFYYILYAYARISGLLRQLQESHLSWDERVGLEHVDLLVKPQEIFLVSLMSRYPDVSGAAATACELQHLAYYLSELANGLHSYYNVVQLFCEQEALKCARLCLLKAVRQVLRNGVQLLGISVPESM